MRVKKTLILLVVISAIFVGACAPTLSQTREDYVKANPNLDPQIKEAILSGKAIPGMTAEDVKASCGSPNIATRGAEAGKYCDYWGYKRYSVTFGPEGKVIKVTPKSE